MKYFELVLFDQTLAGLLAAGWCSLSTVRLTMCDQTARSPSPASPTTGWSVTSPRGELTAGCCQRWRSPSTKSGPLCRAEASWWRRRGLAPDLDPPWYRVWICLRSKMNPTKSCCSAPTTTVRVWEGILWVFCPKAFQIIHSNGIHIQPHKS